MTDERRVSHVPPDAERLERYVLGLLDEGGLEEIESRAFSEPGLATAIDEVETELVDAYAAGTLAWERREAFARALAARPRLRARVDVARRLATHRAPDASRSVWWLPLLATAAVLVLAGMWLMRETSPEPSADAPQHAEQQPVEPEPELELLPLPTPGSDAVTGPPPDASASPDATRRPRTTFAMVLPSGTTRAAAATDVPVPASATHVLLRMPVAEGDDFPSYRLRLVTPSGATVEERVANVLARDRMLPIVVGRSVLPDGPYDVVLDGLGANGVAEPLAFIQILVVTRIR